MVFWVCYLKLQKKNSNKHYALKIKKNNLSSEYENEITVMKNIKSKYVIELKDHFYDKKNKGYCIVMELCDGDLRLILNKYKPNGIPLNIINKIFFQLNDALKAMRAIDYTHRDLKPENILIKYTDENKTNFDIKLTDFGLSSNEVHSTVKTQSSKAGTEKYMAPELENFKYNDKCDLWSLGVILYELYTNEYIFDSDISKKNGKIVKETDNENINKLIRKLIQVDIKKRIEWEEYFNDDFFIINNNENEQIIKLKIKVNNDNDFIKIYNGNDNINEEKIKLIKDKKEIKFQKKFDDLEKGIYEFVIKINQKITKCNNMFLNCKNIIEINFTQINTKNVTDMNSMFSFCSSLNNLNITKFDTKNVNNMSYMFENCSSLQKLDVTNFDTKNVTDMNSMFKNCTSLKDLNVSKFNTKNVTNMSCMFTNCSSLNNLDVKNFDTKNVTDMNCMFLDCISLNNLKFNNFDTNNAADKTYMFYNCPTLNKLNDYDKNKLK